MKNHLNKICVCIFPRAFLSLAFLLLLVQIYSQAQSISSQGNIPQLSLPQIDIIATTPMGSSGIPLERFAGNAQVIGIKEIPVDSVSVPDILNDLGNSIFMNDTQGNPFNVDLNYRGFTASPTLLDHPKGYLCF